MVANECEYCHESLCIAKCVLGESNECEYCYESLCIGKCVLGESFECKGMVKKDIVIECHAENLDLVDGCIMCEYREANAKFPYEEYCKECAEEIKKLEEKQTK